MRVGDKGERSMVRVVAVFLITVLSCADLSFAQPVNLHPNQPYTAIPAQPVPCSGDAMYCEIKQLVEDQSNCFVREARSKRIAKVDLETAAYAVVSSCIGPTQRLKAFQAGHHIRSVGQMQQYWADNDRKDREHVKGIIALIRTGN
jgi:hypothetical protein